MEMCSQKRGEVAELPKRKKKDLRERDEEGFSRQAFHKGLVHPLPMNQNR